MRMKQAKITKKKNLPGEGLLGQCYLEQDFYWFSDFPRNYVKIASGLGEANAESMLLSLPCF